MKCAARRRVRAGLSLTAIAVWLAVGTVEVRPAAASAEADAQAIYHGYMSPYCPGRRLRSCQLAPVANRGPHRVAWRSTCLVLLS